VLVVVLHETLQDQGFELVFFGFAEHVGRSL
jgi:hypothetical protein